MKNNYLSITTHFDKDNKTIYQEEISTITNQIIQSFLYTKEDQIKDALIGLGWTPPKDNNERI